jgi:ribonuclease P protein component
MIGAAHRFHGYNSLRGVYQRGQTVRGPMISLRFAERQPGRRYRVAVVVSRKVSKSAVVRNRIRRRIYEVVRRVEVPAAIDLVFTVFDSQLADMPANKLESSISQLLAKASLQPTSGDHDIVKGK